MLIAHQVRRAGPHQRFDRRMRVVRPGADQGHHGVPGTAVVDDLFAAHVAFRHRVQRAVIFVGDDLVILDDDRGWLVAAPSAGPTAVPGAGVGPSRRRRRRRGQSESGDENSYQMMALPHEFPPFVWAKGIFDLCAAPSGRRARIDQQNVAACAGFRRLTLKR